MSTPKRHPANPKPTSQATAVEGARRSDVRVGSATLRVASRVLVIVGGAAVFKSILDASLGVFLAGLVCIIAASVMAFARVLAVPPKGTSFSGRVHALWQNPWVLTYDRRFFVLPAVVLAGFMISIGQTPLVRVASYVALILVCGVMHLGSPHDFVHRILDRTLFARTAPVVSNSVDEAEMWKRTDLRAPPPGFPDIPSGKIIAVFQNVRTKSYAVAIDKAGQRPEEWNRWSTSSSTWETQRGLARVESHDIWDGRPEAIVTVTVASMMIVIEGVAGKEQTLSNAKLLVRALVAPEVKGSVQEAKAPLFDGVLGYSAIPAMAPWVSAATLIAMVSSSGNITAGGIIQLIFLTTLWYPLHCVVLNLIGIFRPRTFRLTKKSLRLRAQGVFWLGIAPTGLALLFHYLTFAGMPQEWIFVWLPFMLLVVALISMFGIRDPNKPRK